MFAIKDDKMSVFLWNSGKLSFQNVNTGEKLEVGVMVPNGISSNPLKFRPPHPHGSKVTEISFLLIISNSKF